MKKNILVLSTLGLMFSGYLSGVKFFTSTCAFKESCPIFLGQPACYYGFAMFLTLFVLSLSFFLGKMEAKKILTGISAVSALGILFAGYFTLAELPKLFSEGLTAYVLGLPTCALGLIFYIALFVLAFREMKKTA